MIRMDGTKRRKKYIWTNEQVTNIPNIFRYASTCLQFILAESQIIMREYIKGISMFVICQTAYLLSYISAIKPNSSSAIFNFNDILTIGQQIYLLNVSYAFVLSFPFLRIFPVKKTNLRTKTFELLMVTLYNC